MNYSKFKKSQEDDIEDLCRQLNQKNKTYVLAVANALVFTQEEYFVNEKEGKKIEQKK